MPKIKDLPLDVGFYVIGRFCCAFGDGGGDGRRRGDGVFPAASPALQRGNSGWRGDGRRFLMR